MNKRYFVEYIDIYSIYIIEDIDIYDLNIQFFNY